MSFGQEPIFLWLSQYAFEPNFVYAGIFLMMLASGFGFPLPEEVTILSVGILAFMGANPEHFPPPYAGAPVVNGYEAAIVTLFSVIFADMLVFTIGRTFGRKLMISAPFKRLFSGAVMDKVNGFVKKYGIYAAFIFRFTPGIRFPAHIFLGVSHFSAWRFLLVDGLAALISVPTQVLLIYHYGEPILKQLQKFKIFIACGLVLFLLWFAYRKISEKQKASRSEAL